MKLFWRDLGAETTRKIDYFPQGRIIDTASDPEKNRDLVEDIMRDDNGENKELTTLRGKLEVTTVLIHQLFSDYRKKIGEMTSLQEELKAAGNKEGIDFIKNQSNLQLIDTYVDNGFTGMNFDRPDFTRLIEDVKTGRIRCIVVKDLSRFGRDYLETGYFIETIFPKLGVRLIAITDDFDSSRPEDRESLAVPIKNIVNTLYAKDISRKIASSYEVKRRRGETMGTFPPYGYRYNEERTRYLVDEEAAPYVRMMFQWAVIGLNKHEIARRLQLMGVPTPRQRQIMLHEGRADTEFTKWHGSVVLKLLINPVYMGDTVTGKTRRAAYKNQGLTYIDPEEWCYTRNTHEPLVSREDFEVIKQKRATNKQKRAMALEKSKSEREKLPDCFRGLVFCADCGGIMRMFRNSHDGTEKSYSQYTCVAKKSIHSCARHSIQENLLKILVMDQIHIMIKEMCDRKQILKKYSKSESEQSYAIIVKLPALLLEFRRLLTFEEDNQKYYYTLNGTLFPEDNVIIYDIESAEKQTSKTRKQKEGKGNRDNNGTGSEEIVPDKGNVR